MQLKDVVRTLKWAFHFIVENDLELLKAFFFDSSASISKVLGCVTVATVLGSNPGLGVSGQIFYQPSYICSPAYVFVCLFLGVNSQAILL